ncbi:hypothetical protein R83H12_01679 [Fibrobacteria bacterium R8-3-H12]
MLKKLLCLPLLAILFQITSCGDGYEYDETIYKVLGGDGGGGVKSPTTPPILETII